MNCRDTARFQASDRYSEISKLLSLLQFDYFTGDRRNIKTVRQRKMWIWKKIV